MTPQGSLRKRAKKADSTPTPPPAVEGLNTLDKERAASVADEGGATAATVETQEQPQPK